MRVLGAPIVRGLQVSEGTGELGHKETFFDEGERDLGHMTMSVLDATCRARQGSVGEGRAGGQGVSGREGHMSGRMSPGIGNSLGQCLLVPYYIIMLGACVPDCGRTAPGSRLR